MIKYYLVLEEGINLGQNSAIQTITSSQLRSAERQNMLGTIEIPMPTASIKKETKERGIKQAID
jgi:hypothetical protein